MLGVAGSVDHPDPHGPCLDDVSVLQADTRLCVVDILRGREPVARTGQPGQIEASAHVVVVHVRLQDPGDPGAEPAGQGETSIDVPRGIDDDGDRAVARDVAAVAEAGRLQGHHRDRGGASQMSTSRRRRVAGQRSGGVRHLRPGEPCGQRRSLEPDLAHRGGLPLGPPAQGADRPQVGGDVTARVDDRALAVDV